MTEAQFTAYLRERLEDQIKYFDTSAIKNQKLYRSVKMIGIICNVLTTIAIALAFTVPEATKLYMSIAALMVKSGMLV